MNKVSEAQSISRVSCEQFFSDYYDQFIPVIITDVVDKWPAFGQWSVETLKQKLATKQVEMSISDTNSFVFKENGAAEYQIETMSFEQAITDIQQAEKNQCNYYITQKSIPDIYPELMPDIIVPPWIGDSLKAANLWLGSQGNYTPLHFDFADNFICVVMGAKAFTIYDPAQFECLYAHPISHRYAHTSQVNIMKPDLQRFPKFSQAKPITFTLQKGEMLYLPSHWWHAVVSENVNTMVNFWAQGRDLSLYLTNPTGLHSISSIFQQDLLQSLVPLLQKEQKSFLDCAQQVLNLRPSTAILLLFAHIVHFVLTLKIRGKPTHRQPAQLGEQIQALASNGVITKNDISVIVSVESLASQTYQHVKITEAQIHQAIAQVQQMIARVGGH